jgi:hypothetical protein
MPALHVAGGQPQRRLSASAAQPGMDAPAQRMNDKLLCGSTVSEVLEVLVGVVANQRG